MMKNLKSTSVESKDNRKDIIEKLSVFLEQLPYDFKDIDSNVLVEQYKKEMNQATS